MDRGNPLVRLIERLDEKCRLSRDDKNLLDELPVSIKSFSSNRDIAQRGDITTHCWLPLDGQVVQSRITELYKRQILSFHVPGDLVGLHGLFMGKTEHTVSSMGQSVVGFVTHESIRALLSKSPNLTKALWRETFIATSIGHEWAIRLGGREGIARVAHLICEMALRLRPSNQPRLLVFEVPWTQLDVGDACGLSNVHVNRIVQTFRVGGLIEWRFKTIKIRKWEDLVKIAEFSPDYLHIPYNGNSTAHVKKHSECGAYAPCTRQL